MQWRLDQTAELEPVKLELVDRQQASELYGQVGQARRDHNVLADPGHAGLVGLVLAGASRSTPPCSGTLRSDPAPFASVELAQSVVQPVVVTDSVCRTCTHSVRFCTVSAARRWETRCGELTLHIRHCPHGHLHVRIEVEPLHGNLSEQRHVTHRPQWFESCEGVEPTDSQVRNLEDNVQESIVC